HPGGAIIPVTHHPERIDERQVLHWFALRRPGQHRGIPEFRSTLNVGASARRWREATVAAAETAADFSVLLKTNLTPDGTADLAAPFSEMEIQKRMATSLPMGWDATQMDGKHPNSTFGEFNRAQIA